MRKIASACELGCKTRIVLLSSQALMVPQNKHSRYDSRKGALVLEKNLALLDLYTRTTFHTGPI